MYSQGDQLLKEAFDIMSCNDPRQPILPQIAAYLKERGYAMEEEEPVDDTHRFVLDTGDDTYKYRIELITGRSVGLRAALGLEPHEPIPECIVEIDGKPVGSYTYTCT